MGPGTWQILLVALLAILLFGRGRVSDLMGDVAKGIKSFKKGMSDDEEEIVTPNNKGKVIDHDAAEKVDTVSLNEKSKVS